MGHPVDELLLAGLTHSLYATKALDPGLGPWVWELRESPEGVISILGLGAGMVLGRDVSPNESNTTWFSEEGSWLDLGWFELGR